MGFVLPSKELIQTIRGMLVNPDTFLNATEVWKIEFKEYVEATSLLNSKEIGEKYPTGLLTSFYNVVF